MVKNPSVYVTVVTDDGKEYPLYLNESFETFVVGRRYLFHALPPDENTEHPELNAFRCYYSIVELNVDDWIVVGKAARESGLSSFPMIVTYNADNVLVFESFGLVNNHEYQYPYESSNVSLTGGEIPKLKH